MAQAKPLTDKLRDWFERSPKAQRAYQRLSADLDTVVGRMDAATSDLQKRVAPLIDPSPRPQTPGPATATPTTSESGGAPKPDEAEGNSDSVIPESESSVPPGIKKDGQPVDPTT